jgi:hypothetical protein
MAILRELLGLTTSLFAIFFFDLQSSLAVSPAQRADISELPEQIN